MAHRTVPRAIESKMTAVRRRLTWYFADQRVDLMVTWQRQFGSQGRRASSDFRARGDAVRAGKQQPGQGAKPA